MARLSSTGRSVRIAPVEEDSRSGSCRGALARHRGGREHGDLQPRRCGDSEALACQGSGHLAYRGMDEQGVPGRGPECKRRFLAAARRAISGLFDQRHSVPPAGAGTDGFRGADRDCGCRSRCDCRGCVSRRAGEYPIRERQLLPGTGRLALDWAAATSLW